MKKLTIRGFGRCSFLHCPSILSSKPATKRSVTKNTGLAISADTQTPDDMNIYVYLTQSDQVTIISADSCRMHFPSFDEPCRRDRVVLKTVFIFSTVFVWERNQNLHETAATGEDDNIINGIDARSKNHSNLYTYYTHPPNLLCFDADAASDVQVVPSMTIVVVVINKFSILLPGNLNTL